MNTLFLETNPPDSGSVYYFQFWNEAGQGWNGSAFATYNTTRDTWDFPATEIGVTGVYTVTIPTFADGTLVRWSGKKQSGGSPSHANDSVYVEGINVYKTGVGFVEIDAFTIGGDAITIEIPQ